MANIKANSCDVCTHRDVCKNREVFQSIVAQLTYKYVNVNGANIELLNVDFVESVTVNCAHFLQERCVLL